MGVCCWPLLAAAESAGRCAWGGKEAAGCVLTGPTALVLLLQLMAEVGLRFVCSVGALGLGDMPASD